MAASVLEEKGHLKHRRNGARYVYVPRVPRETASRFAIRRVVSTFFQGSVTHAVAALLETSDAKLSPAELRWEDRDQHV